jgi:trans-aconitate methyltransferase
MGAASHLGIKLSEYDARIRTFIPYYTELIAVAATVVGQVAPHAPLVVDLGIGSGALARRILATCPDARLVGIDEDEGMLALAHRRLRGRVTTVRGNFERVPLPACDVISASLALHHVRTRRQKAALYRRAFAALRRGGALVTADCQPPSHPGLRAAARTEWLAHLRRSYSAAKAASYLTAWAREDVYVSLDDEIDLLEGAGFKADVTWRRGGFAVIVAARPQGSSRTRGHARL